MSLYETIKARRSTKHFDPDHQLTDDELRTLVAAGALAPTSFNMHNRHFVVVLDRDVKTQLMEAAWGQKQVRDASVAIVITGDLEAHRNTDRYLRNLPDDKREGFRKMILGFYEGNDALLRDEACRTIGLAGMSIMLMATDMGYGSGALIGFDPGKVSEILGLDERHPPLLMIVVGKPARPSQPRLGLLDFEEQVSVDQFGNHAMKGVLAV